MLGEEKVTVPESTITEGVLEVRDDIEVVEPIVNEETTSVPNVKKKWFLLLFVVVTIIIVAVLMTRNLASNSDSDIEPFAICAHMTDDGTAYIPLFDGTSIEIDGDVSAAVLTQDRKHIVVLQQDGLLYVTDGQLTDKTTIADDATTILVRSDGFLYKDEYNSIYRVTFDDYASIKIGRDIAFTVAAHTTSVLYANREGNVYALAATDSEATLVGNWDNSIEVVKISDDGKTSVWVEKNDDNYTIYLNEDDDRTVLGQVDPGYYEYIDVTFTDDQKMTVVTHSDCIWIKNIESEPVEVKLPSESELVSAFYTVNGDLSNEMAKNVQSLYFYTSNYSQCDLYNLSLSGDYERVRCTMKNFTISNGYIIYMDAEENLYYGKLNGTEVLEEEKIDSGVDEFKVTENGKYVYYVKYNLPKDSFDRYEEQTLCCYKLGENKSIMIESGPNQFGLIHTEYSTDGATVFYFKDTEWIDGLFSHGTLMMWTYGDETSEIIASEVIQGSITSGQVYSGPVDKNSLVFREYVSVDNDDNIYVNWMYYNGTDTTMIAADLLDGIMIVVRNESMIMDR